MELTIEQKRRVLRAINLILFKPDPNSMLFNELVIGQLPKEKEPPIIGLDGEDGVDGYTPIKGVDYFDGQDGESIVGPPGPKPIAGVDYPIPKNGEDGYTPVKEVDYFDGKAGKDGSPDTAEEIVAKINSVLPDGPKINAEQILDLPTYEGFMAYLKAKKWFVTKAELENKLLNQPAKGPLDQRWHGGGATSTGGYQAPTSGVVNGVNTIFVFTTAPNVIVVDQGRAMRATSSDGTVNWIGTTTITLTVAPIFDIYAVAWRNYYPFYCFSYPLWPRLISLILGRPRQLAKAGFSLWE